MGCTTANNNIKEIFQILDSNEGLMTKYNELKIACSMISNRSLHVFHMIAGNCKGPGGTPLATSSSWNNSC